MEIKARDWYDRRLASQHGAILEHFRCQRTLKYDDRTIIRKFGVGGDPCHGVGLVIPGRGRWYLEYDDEKNWLIEHRIGDQCVWRVACENGQVQRTDGNFTDHTDDPTIRQVLHEIIRQQWSALEKLTDDPSMLVDFDFKQLVYLGRL